MTEVAHEGTRVTGLQAELADQIAAKRALIVVGTGVSLAATGGNDLASWKGLIASGIKRCVEINLCKPTWAASQQKALLEGDLDDLLGVAEQVSRRLGWEPTDPCGGEWNKWLRETAGALRASQPELIQAIRDLDAPIATLNYDNLLTEVTDQRPITWKNAERWLPVLRREDEAILHLHGHWDQPSSVVLGIRAYDAVIGKELAQHLQRVLASLHSLVFIGCSGTVQDPNFSALVGWMHDQLRGAEHSHYLFVRESEPLPVEDSMLRSAGIVPLRYGAEHTDLLPFIRDLAPGGGLTQEKPIRVVAQKQTEARHSQVAEEQQREALSRPPGQHDGGGNDDGGGGNKEDKWRWFKLITPLALVFLVGFAGVLAWQQWSGREEEAVTAPAPPPAETQMEEEAVTAPAPPPAETQMEEEAVRTLDSRQEWAKNWFRPIMTNKYNVIVYSFPPSTSKSTAIDEAHKMEEKYPGVAFCVGYTISYPTQENERYVLYLASGVRSDEAENIVKYARQSLSTFSGPFKYKQKVNTGRYCGPEDITADRTDSQ